MADMTSPYGTGATPPVAAAGYPLTDPYTNPQYWSQRGSNLSLVWMWLLSAQTP